MSILLVCLVISNVFLHLEMQDLNFQVYEMQKSAHANALNEGDKLVKAIVANDEINFELLLNSETVNYKMKDGLTPLHSAVANNRSNMIKKLLIKGANVNAVTSEGMSVFHLVVYSENIDTLNLLLSMADEANLTLKDMNGLSPLQLAKNYENEVIAQLLISAIREDSGHKIETCCPNN